MSKCFAMAPEHEASGGILVETVRQGGRARQTEPQGVEIVLEAHAALRSAMHRKAGGFVDDQHQAVAVKHAGLHVVGSNLFKWHDETGITAADMNDSTTDAPDATRHVFCLRVRGALIVTHTGITPASS